MPKSTRNAALATLALAAALACQGAAAQSVDAARTAVRKALQSNPEVVSKLNAYLAKSDAVDIAKAGWLPKVDLSADVGTERTKNKTLPGATVNRAGAGITISQVLWDGLGTSNDVKRATHERLNRWFEFIDATEQTALEATRAVYDVQRQRKLVALAEDNLAQHRQAAAKIESRVSAGVGRGVDLDQAKARLALAESNLETELSNLHDVAARYQRIVGDTPAADMGQLEMLRQGMPGSAGEAVNTALSKSPLIAAGIENLRAARAVESGRKSALQPRVEARARVGGGENYTGIDGRRGDAAVELVMNWNLFNGGADMASLREQKNLVGQALDLRDKACRDVRQNVAMAFNEATKLSGQLSVLARNSAAIERARDAYRQQFDIGQRSLLDLLNAENEAYTARRALTNAAYDRAVANVRTLAAMSQLNVQLDIARDMLHKDAQNWSADGDGASRCPAQAVDMSALRAGLDNPGAASVASLLPATGVQAAPVPVQAAAATAAQGGAWSAPVAAGNTWSQAAPAVPPARAAAGRQPAAAPAAAAATPAAAGLAKTVAHVPAAAHAAAAATAPAKVPAAADADDPAVSEITPLVSAWAQAWRKKDLKRYAALYAPGFSGDEDNNRQWMAKHKYLFGRKQPVKLEVDGLTAEPLSNGEVETRFRQVQTAGDQRTVQDKVLVWKQVAGQWRIARETSL